VAELGAGIVLGKSPAAAKLRTMATYLLAESAFKEAASRIGNDLRIAGGAPKAADMIEEFLNVNTKL
jgi:UDP:flavonoid glycosyltransferase YjiC (YdhE family)